MYLSGSSMPRCQNSTNHLSGMGREGSQASKQQQQHHHYHHQQASTTVAADMQARHKYLVLCCQGLYTITGVQDSGHPVVGPWMAEWTARWTDKFAAARCAPIHDSRKRVVLDYSPWRLGNPASVHTRVVQSCFQTKGPLAVPRRSAWAFHDRMAERGPHSS